jgi:polyisoprenyl-teichoic acid--peptidoglycan teichoic acid transferase
VISIDPSTESIGILSIPRDTYVEVPNYGLQRINTACVLGNLEKPGYGPVLAMQTVQYNFGIRVNEYMMVNFNAFISIIDRIGGVDINNIAVIDDPQYPSMDYGYDPFYLPIGQHHLDGATALKYARSRHNSDDVDRQRRQQEIISAVRQRVLELDMLDNLILEAPGLWNDLDEGIATSLDLQQDIIPLALYAKDIPDENIHKGIVSWEYLFSYQTPGGASVLVPKRSVLGTLMTEVFGENYSQ